MGRLIIDGNRVFEVDEECMKRKNLDLNFISQYAQESLNTDERISNIQKDNDVKQNHLY